MPLPHAAGPPPPPTEPAVQSAPVNNGTALFDNLADYLNYRWVAGEGAGCACNGGHRKRLSGAVRSTHACLPAAARPSTCSKLKGALGAPAYSAR
jgi:hypothetical protein